MPYRESILDPIACRDPKRAEDLARTDRELESFEVLVARNALACSELREHTDQWHRRNDAQARALDQQHFDALRRIGAI